MEERRRRDHRLPSPPEGLRVPRIASIQDCRSSFHFVYPSLFVNQVNRPLRTLDALTGRATTAGEPLANYSPVHFLPDDAANLPLVGTCQTRVFSKKTCTLPTKN